MESGLDFKEIGVHARIWLICNMFKINSYSNFNIINIIIYYYFFRIGCRAPVFHNLWT
jgi:hypothetical protein